MSKLTLEHKRRLSSDETIKKGDVYIRYGNHYDANVVHPVKHSIGRTPKSYEWGGYQFYRRLHTKKPVQVSTTPAPKQTEPVTIVEFDYNQATRLVQVIKLTDKHLKGLEITEGRDQKRKYQFKSFLRSRIYSGPVLAHYGPIADFKG